MLESSSVKPVKKRLRIPVSCKACRKRKTKCDRDKPKCGYCAVNDIECVYEDKRSWVNNFDVNSDAPLMAKNNSCTNSSSNEERYGSEVASFTNHDEKSYLELEDEIASLKKELLELKLSNLPPSITLPKNLPPIDDNDCLNFYSGYNPRLKATALSASCQGAFSSQSLIKKDPFIRLLWLKLVASKARREFLQALRPSEPTQNLDNIYAPFFNFTNDHKGFRDLANGEEMLTVPNELRDKEIKSHGTSTDMKDHQWNNLVAQIKSSSIPTTGHSLSNFPQLVPLGSCFISHNMHADFQLYLAKKLPTKRAIWLLIDRFFKYAYPFMPYIDQKIFIDDLTKLIGPRNLEEVKIDNVPIKRGLDFATIGILLMVLEFGSFTLFANSDKSLAKAGVFKVTDPDMKYLLDNPLLDDENVGAKFCLGQFRVFKKVTIEVAQLAVYLRLYDRYSPQDGDSLFGSNSLIFNGAIMQMAYAIGLNRDPSGFEDIAGLSDDRSLNLRRKLWYGVLNCDSYQFYILGIASSTRVDFFDTNLPNNKSSNCEDSKIENFVIESVSNFAKIDGLIKDFIYECSSFKREVSVKELISKTHTLESYIDEKYVSLSDILLKSHDEDKHINNIKKVDATLNYLHAKVLLQLIYYNIYLNYESSSKNNELAVYFLKKILGISTELMEVCPHVIKNSSLYYGRGLDFIINPTLQLVCHKSLQMRGGLYSRFVHFKMLLKTDGTLPSFLRTQLNNVIDVIFYPFSKVLSSLFFISDRYCYAWKLTKLQRIFVLMIMNDNRDRSENFYEAVKNDDGTFKLKLRGDDEGVIEIPQRSVFSALSLPTTLEILNYVASLRNEENLAVINGSKRPKNNVDHNECRKSFSNLKNESNNNNNVFSRVEISTSANSDDSIQNWDWPTSSSLNLLSPKIDTSNNIFPDPDIDKTWLNFMSDRVNNDMDGIHSDVKPLSNKGPGDVINTDGLYVFPSESESVPHNNTNNNNQVDSFSKDVSAEYISKLEVLMNAPLTPTSENNIVNRNNNYNESDLIALDQLMKFVAEDLY
ncbi:hypothetical protein PACTADRAFT_185602 [Pachysolen tannophilus NRRL Y-2460]|uniref:Zn(2)-C6 fungal-type domain-containing protein n=1 Tax=Pachysolen tannophilus NRRL Y-2460 TaxID=669874 RepID=A0A1E4U205_PACTA|nr:hypothetical protein PACTADRAFT_185602 [Pachysolen tannophilus NRRL Y-2460]